MHLLLFNTFPSTQYFGLPTQYFWQCWCCNSWYYRTTLK